MNPNNQDQTPNDAQSHLSAVHLTDEQFTYLFLGTIPSSAVAAHLRLCPQCAEEAQRVSGAIGSFAQQSRLWAEHRAATRPAQTPARPASLAWLRSPIPPAAWIAATFLLGAGLGLEHRAQHRASHLQTVATVQPSPAGPAAVAPTTLKADNDLLSAIDGELSNTDLSGTQNYGLNANRQSTRAHSAKGISN